MRPLYSTGLPSLDHAMGRIGGLVEVWGPESSGKTTLGYHMLRKGGLLISTEHEFDPTLAPGVVDRDKLIVLRPRFGEAALEAAGEALPGRVVIDSASALTPAVFLGSKLWEEKQVGAKARMLAYGARQLAKVCRDEGGLVVFIQQQRKTLGSKLKGSTRIPYGRGPAEFSNVRIKMTRGEPIHRGHRRIGVTINLNIVRNKFAPPGREVRLDLLYGQGFRVSASLLDFAMDMDVIVRSGSWYKLDGQVLGQGRDSVCTNIEEGSLWGRIASALKHVGRRYT